MNRLLLALAFFGLVSCEENMNLDPKQVTEVIYSFQDASVPPEYHRSYSITINKNQAAIEVDSYGDILAKDEFQFSEGQFEDLISTINEAQLKECESNNEAQCTGSTGELISIKEGEKEVYHQYLDHCDKNSNISKCGDFPTVIKAIKAFVPNLESLLG